MLSLLLESSTERSVVAIVREDTCDYFAGLPFGIHSSQYLLPKIEEGFADIKESPKNLDFITVCIGPGSYTGIRVGAIIAKSLSFACKIPLVGICTLEGFIPDRDGKFAAIIDAKMSGAYFLIGERQNGSISYAKEPQILPIESLATALKEIEILVGPSNERLKKILSEQVLAHHWEWQETACDPLHLTRRALAKYNRKEYTLDGSLELLYMRDYMPK